MVVGRGDQEMVLMEAGFRKSKRTPWFVTATLLLFSMVVVSYYFMGTSFPNIASFKPSNGFNSVRIIENENDELSRVLKRAATPDKTVIVTCLNEAWAAPGSLFELLLEGFRNGNNTERLIKHLLVVSLDEKAQSRCLAMGLNCFLLQVEGFNFSGGEAFFRTTNYLEIIWRKVNLLHSVLSLGYNFLFTDTDVMWLRDPFPHLQDDDDVDFQVSCDKYNGPPRDLLRNQPNTGIMYVKSNTRTILFFKLWYYSRHTYEGKHEQEVFNIIKFTDVMNITGLKVKYLDNILFGGFCQMSRDFSKVCSMHANCCVGLKNKIQDLKLVLGDWKRYSSLTSPEKLPHPFKWSAPRQCLWRHQKSYLNKVQDLELNHHVSH